MASGCRGDAANAAPLAHVEDKPTHLVVRSATPVKSATSGSGLTCWAQLSPFDVEVPPEKIEVYLARGLRLDVAANDDGEVLEVSTATLDELLGWIAAAEVTDVKTIIGAYWLQDFLRKDCSAPA